MTDIDIYNQFLQVWNAEYPTWLEQAREAETRTEGGGLEYDHGDYVIPAATQFVEATGHDQVYQQTKQLIDAWMDSAVAGPTHNGKQFPEGTYGWEPNRTALSEMQFACGAARFCGRISDGSLGSAYDAEWAREVALLLDLNIVLKWWDNCGLTQGNYSFARRNVHDQITGAAQRPPRGAVSDKFAIWTDTAFSLRAVLGADCTPWTGQYAERWGTPDDWLRTWSRHIAKIHDEGILLWDRDNPHVHQASPDSYWNHDTIHSNRTARMLVHEYLRNGFRTIPSYIYTAACKTLCRRIWNGEWAPHLLTNTWITGEWGYRYETLGPLGWAGIEGAGWVYNGWNQLGILDWTITDICRELLKMLDDESTPDSWTIVRHSTPYGRLGLCAGILWCDGRARDAESPGRR